MFWTESIAQYWSGEDILTRRESTFLGKSTWKNIGADGDTWAEKTKMVFGYQNSSDILWEKKCSSDREKLLKFEAEGREFANFFRPLEQFIQTVKGQNNFW